jgi:hypothetical protein
VGLLQTVPATGLTVCSSIRILVIKTGVAVVCMGTFGKKLSCLLNHREKINFLKKSL